MGFKVNTVKVVGIGALNIDYIYKVERILDDGEAVVEGAEISPGGSSANTIYSLAKLGVKAGFIGVVGDDEAGKILLEDFQKVGVDTSQVRVKPGARTGSTLCLSDREGKRSLYVLPGVNNLLTMNDLDLEYINQAEILHMSSFAGDAQLGVLLEMTNKLASSIKVSFAPGALYAARGLKALAPILGRTHILFIDLEEMGTLTGNNVVPGSEACINLGCQFVAVTLGKGIPVTVGKRIDGKSIRAVCYIKDAKNDYAVESVSQKLASDLDTTGAGDAFAGGFLYGLLKGKGPEDCGRIGDIVAQFSISQTGARQGLPTLEQLAQRYRELYTREL